MPGFRKVTANVPGVTIWEGDPDDEAAHQRILSWLESAVDGRFLEATSAVSNRVKGNLGEFVAYGIGATYVFTNVADAFGANTWAPLSDISRPDLDIVWLHFGDTEQDDWAALQEVKTTGQERLDIADGLVSDYDKLFGEDVQLTLQTRLGALKNKLEQQGQADKASRITKLGGSSPERAEGVKLVPTLMHDNATVSSSKMTLVRQALIGRGWSAGTIECWSILLGDLDRRLCLIAQGR